MKTKFITKNQKESKRLLKATDMALAISHIEQLLYQPLSASRLKKEIRQALDEYNIDTSELLDYL